MDSLNQNTPPGFDAVVGATVPNTIVITPVTAQAGGTQGHVPEVLFQVMSQPGGVGRVGQRATTKVHGFLPA